MSDLSDHNVSYCVDTNLLVEFAALGSIPWRSLAPNAANVRIVIPTKVGEEMDQHKNKSGRLRRRAIEFSQLSRRMEDSADGVVVLREEGPRVTVEFGPLFRRSDLDADLFELDDSDNRIVAEAYAIAKNVPGLKFLADDSKPIRLARQAQLPYVRPPAEWRRKEGPDERDMEISDLKKEIGALPVLTLAVAGLNNGRVVIEDGAPFMEPSCVKAFEAAVFKSAPQATHDELIARHGIYTPGPFELGFQANGKQGLSRAQLDKYDKAYDLFVTQTEKIAAGLHKGLSQLGYSRHLEITIANEGGRAGDKVVVEAELSSPFRFLPTSSISKQLKSMLEAPARPEPAKGLGDIRYPQINLREQLAPPRIDIFHEHDQLEQRGKSNFVSWRCEELRQGASFKLAVLIVTDDPEARGLLSISASGASLAKKTILQVPLETKQLVSPAGKNYFLLRLGHIPKAYREAFRTELAVVTDDSQ